MAYTKDEMIVVPTEDKIKEFYQKHNKLVDNVDGQFDLTLNSTINNTVFVEDKKVYINNPNDVLIEPIIDTSTIAFESDVSHRILNIFDAISGSDFIQNLSLEFVKIKYHAVLYETVNNDLRFNFKYYLDAIGSWSNFDIEIYNNASEIIDDIARLKLGNNNIIKSFVRDNIHTGIDTLQFLFTAPYHQVATNSNSIKLNQLSYIIFYDKLILETNDRESFHGSGSPNVNGYVPNIESDEYSLFLVKNSDSIELAYCDFYDNGNLSNFLVYEFPILSPINDTFRTKLKYYDGKYYTILYNYNTVTPAESTFLLYEITLSGRGASMIISVAEKLNLTSIAPYDYGIYNDVYTDILDFNLVDNIIHITYRYNGNQYKTNYLSYDLTSGETTSLHRNVDIKQLENPNEIPSTPLQLPVAPKSIKTYSNLSGRIIKSNTLNFVINKNFGTDDGISAFNQFTIFLPNLATPSKIDSRGLHDNCLYGNGIYIVDDIGKYVYFCNFKAQYSGLSTSFLIYDFGINDTVDFHLIKYKQTGKLGIAIPTPKTNYYGAWDILGFYSAELDKYIPYIGGV